MSKIFIAYYSWSGDTRKVAEQIQSITGGTLFEIEPAIAYPEEYNDVVKQAKKEIGNGFMPEINNTDGLDGYDTVFIGSPNWWSTIAPPVAAFLNESALDQKTIIPFCSHGGGGKAHVFEDIAKRCPGSVIREGLAVYGGKVNEAGVRAWLEETGVI